MSRSYNTDSLSEIAGGDEEFMAIVAKTFLEEIPPDLEALQEAVMNDNKELAYQFAHKMKPNIEMLGITVLKDITTIESWTKSSKKSEAVHQNLQNISEALHIVFLELKQDYQL